MAKARDIPGLDGRISFRAVAREAVDTPPLEVVMNTGWVYPRCFKLSCRRPR